MINNRDLFSKTLANPGSAKNVVHKVPTEDHPPINCVPFRAGVKEKKVIQESINEMLKQGVIRPSYSPWAAPVVLVNKKDGSVRFCVDYREINKIVKRDVHPLPRIDDSLYSQGRAKFFTSLDLTSGYWQVPMDENDVETTAFISHYGLYEFLVMPFELSNAPATFQRYFYFIFFFIYLNLEPRPLDGPHLQYAHK